MKLRPLLLRLLLVLAFCAQAWAGNGMHPVHAPKAMVATLQPEASQAGVAIMQQGGNAVDAAVAVGFALAVVLPQAGNIGGGGFLLFRRADGEVHFLDYREKAPAKATANMYLDGQGNVVPDMSIIGYKAIGVPGSVAGLVYAQKHWGKLTLKQVMEPAIRLARDGFVLDYEEARSFRDPQLAKFPESHRIFQRDGDYYQQGDVFKQPELAKTLERIAENPDDFYHGAMARELAATIEKGGGLITAEDLAQYEVKERQPIRGTYRGYESSALRRHRRAASLWSRFLTFWKATIWRSRGNARHKAFISPPRRISARSSIALNFLAIPTSRRFRLRN